ncbi:MAG: hypothetical protein ACT4PO_05855 [Actinomycetota bacterium]
MPVSGIVVVGLAEFRTAVRRAAAISPRAISTGLKKAGVPILAQARANAPKLTGALAASYSTAVRGPRADIISRAPYGGGAEWGRFGKWAGFARYGDIPRFVWPAIEQRETEAALILEHELREVITIMGWAR